MAAAVITAIIGAFGERGEAMSRTLRPLAAVALIAIVALMSSCGSNAPAPTGSGSSGGGNTTANVAQAVKFAQCMRANGVSQFPDPDASGQLTIDGVANGSSVDTSSVAFQQATSTCKGLEPAGFMGHTRSAQQQQAALKFAQCMRDNGVSDFPDPTADGPLIDTNRIPSLAGKDPRSDPGFNAATQKCRGFASAAGVTGGP
jgi:hypothetical protein